LALNKHYKEQKTMKTECFKRFFRSLNRWIKSRDRNTFKGVAAVMIIVVLIGLFVILGVMKRQESRKLADAIVILVCREHDCGHLVPGPKTILCIYVHGYFGDRWMLKIGEGLVDKYPMSEIYKKVEETLSLIEVL
jgi:hypothetical protein